MYDSFTVVWLTAVWTWLLGIRTVVGRSVVDFETPEIGLGVGIPSFIVGGEAVGTVGASVYGDGVGKTTRTVSGFGAGITGNVSALI